MSALVSSSPKEREDDGINLANTTPDLDITVGSKTANSGIPAVIGV